MTLFHRGKETMMESCRGRTAALVTQLVHDEELYY